MARIYDAETGQPITPFFKHGGTLYDVSWSPDSRYVLTCGLDGAVKVWDATTGRPALPALESGKGPLMFSRFTPDSRFILTRNEQFARLWDAVTGEPVTPSIRHPIALATQNSAGLHGTGLEDVIATGDELLALSWQKIVFAPTVPTALPSSVLSDYCRLLSGKRLTAGGTAEAISAAELADLVRSLRARQPELFTDSAETLRRWHEQQAPEPRTLIQLEATIFHLEQLARENPDDTALHQRIDQFKALRIPLRDPATPGHLLDLSHAYTTWLDREREEEFIDLPRGRHAFAGTEFDIRGMVKLKFWEETTAPGREVSPRAVIPVRRRCHALHFLQANQGFLPEGSLVGRWIVRYADRTEREWPLIYGQHLRDWWWSPDKEPRDPADATLAWIGKMGHPDPDEVGVQIRLFKATWSNPDPDREVTEIELHVEDSDKGAPIVLAVTAE
jgi:hypothetical protein